jgi:hypothetical protein
MQFIDQQPCDPLTIEIYAPADLETYTIYDQNSSAILIEYERRGDTLTVRVGVAPGQVELIIYGLGVAAARIDGGPLDVRRLENGGALAVFDGREPREIFCQLETQSEQGEKES